MPPYIYAENAKVEYATLLGDLPQSTVPDSDSDSDTLILRLSVAEDGLRGANISDTDDTPTVALGHWAFKHWKWCLS